MISPGDRCGPPPTIAGVRDRVVRRSEGRPPEQLGDRPFARGRGDDRRRERRRIVERRQQPRDRPGEQGLARARRTDQEQPVTAREGDLEGRRASGWPRTSARSGIAEAARRRCDVGGVGDGRAVTGPSSTRGALSRSPGRGDRIDLDGIRERVDAEHLDRHRRVWPHPRRPGRPRHAPDAATGERSDHREDPGHRAHLAAQRQLAHERRRDRARHGPAPSRAGSRSRSRGRATRRPCAGPPARG